MTTRARRITSTDRISEARLASAAGNNADLYQCVCGAHGIGCRRGPHALVTEVSPPPYYSDLVTLTPTATKEQLAEIAALRLERPEGIGVKDSFCRLDLEPMGLVAFFDAQWVWADAPGDAGAAPSWERVDTSDELTGWEAAWQQTGSPAPGRIFPDSVLAARDIAFYGRRNGDGYDAGLVLNRSPDCIGLSNVFFAGGPHEIFPTALSLAARYGEGLPVTGYSRGAELVAMSRSGFAAIGPLRMWTSPAPA